MHSVFIEALFTIANIQNDPSIYQQLMDKENVAYTLVYYVHCVLCTTTEKVEILSFEKKHVRT